MPSDRKENITRKLWRSHVFAFVASAAGVAGLTAIIQALHLDASVANVSMLYLLVVMLSALYLGRGPAIWASLLSFLSFDWFFVTPRYTFNVQGLAEWLALGMFLLTAMVTGQLTALLKARAMDAKRAQHETAVLAESSWAVASRLDTNSALLEVVRQVARVVDLQMAVVTSIDDDSKARLAAVDTLDTALSADRQKEIQELSCQLTEKLAATTDPLITLPDRFENRWSELPKEGAVCLQIAMNEKLLGIVYLQFGAGSTILTEQRHIIDSLVNHAAVILQRDNLMKRQAKAAALADADRLKTALLSMVSHDFRSPLTSIKASVSALLAEGEPLTAETQRGLCQGIELEADRLNSMVGNILDLSRLEADAWKPRFESTAVTELIGMALDLFNSDCNSRIIVSLDPCLIELYVDPVQMVQVLKNLVENALKYSNPDTRVEIRGSVENGSAIIDVLDRGRGLPSGEIDHIFEPFYRAEELQETSVPGVGIGLAVCRGLVEAHGGHVAAGNRPGGGAFFRVTLPLEQPTEAGDDNS